MAFEFLIQIQEDTPQWHAIENVAREQHISREKAAERLFQEGVQAHLPARSGANLWGIGADDADVLDQIVVDAFEERRNRFERHLDA